MSNEIEKVKTRAKRKLKALDFTGADAAIALVSDSQGGPANGHDYALVIKASNYSDEFLEKMSKVRVEMDIVEYLTRFFGVYGTDAEILARSLGYTTPGMEKAILEAKEEMLEDQEPPEYPSWEDEPGDKKYERYVESKVASIEVMKQLYEAENITDVLSNLSEDKYLQLLIDQQAIEKAFKKIDAEKNKPAKAKVKTKVIEQDNKTDSVEKSTEDVASKIVHEVISEDKPSVVTKHKEKKSMTQEVKVIEQTTEVEMIAKSQFDIIQKQLQDQQVELQKALDLVKQFEAEKKEAIAKSRKEQLVKACGDKAEVIFKACGEASEEDFAAVVKALADMQAVIEKSALFQEQGASVEVEADIESPIAKALKARLTKQQ